MKTTRKFSFLTLGATLAALNLLPLTVTAQTSAASTATVADAKLIQSLKVPSKLDEIAQLSKAGISDPVILAYIKDSPTAYNLNAQDIIRLRDQGVSPEVTSALIQRGAEVRQASQEAAKESPTAEVAAAPTYQTQPVVAPAAPAVVTYVAAPVPPVSTVSVHYFGAPSYRSAPAYYDYAPGYGSSPGYVAFGSSYYYNTPRASFSVGFGGGRYGGHYSRARYCR